MHYSKYIHVGRIKKGEVRFNITKNFDNGKKENFVSVLPLNPNKDVVKEFCEKAINDKSVENVKSTIVPRKVERVTFLRKTFNRFIVRRKTNESIIVDNTFFANSVPLSSSKADDATLEALQAINNGDTIEVIKMKKIINCTEQNIAKCEVKINKIYEKMLQKFYITSPPYGAKNTDFPKWRYDENEANRKRWSKILEITEEIKSHKMKINNLNKLLIEIYNVNTGRRIPSRLKIKDNSNSPTVMKFQTKIEKTENKIQELYKELEHSNYTWLTVSDTSFEDFYKKDEFPDELLLNHKKNQKKWQKIVNLRKDIKLLKTELKYVKADPYKVFYESRNLTLFDFFKKAFHGCCNVFWKQRNSNKIPIVRKNGVQFYCNNITLNEEASKPKKKRKPVKEKTAEEIEAAKEAKRLKDKERRERKKEEKVADNIASDQNKVNRKRGRPSSYITSDEAKEARNQKEKERYHRKKEDPPPIKRKREDESAAVEILIDGNNDNENQAETTRNGQNNINGMNFQGMGYAQIKNAEFSNTWDGIAVIDPILKQTAAVRRQAGDINVEGFLYGKQLGAELLLAPLKLGSNPRKGHWVLLAIQPRQNVAILYDSLYGGPERRCDSGEAFELIDSVYFPELRRNGYLLENTRIIQADGSTYNQQLDNCNCGVHVARIAEQLIFNRISILLEPFDIENERARYFECLQNMADSRRLLDIWPQTLQLMIQRTNRSPDIKFIVKKKAKNANTDGSKVTKKRGPYKAKNKMNGSDKANHTKDLKNRNLKRIQNKRSLQTATTAQSSKSNTKNGICDKNNRLNQWIKEEFSPIKIRCKSKHDTRGCAAISCKHLIPEWCPGNFDQRCENCNALLLPSEKKSTSRKCCGKGKVDLNEKFAEVQNPPDLIKTLCDPDHPLGKEYLPNAKSYNTFFALGSLSVGKEMAPVGNFPVCKYNGEPSINLSDLYCKEGQKPAMGQYYTMSAAESANYRTNAVKEQFTQLKPNMVLQLDRFFREHHVLAKLYRRAHEIFKEAEEAAITQGTPIPKFQISLLTNRQAHAVKDLTDPKLHLHQTELPNVEQVAVIWVSDEGEPPKVKGAKLNGKKGHVVALAPLNANIEPALFPFLFPYGTPGYTLGIKYATCKDKAEIKPKNELDGLEDDEGIANGFDNGDNEYDPHKQLYHDGKINRAKPRVFVSWRQYLCYMIQMRSESTMAYHWLWSHRALAQLYICIALNRVELHELEWEKALQDNLRVTRPAELLRGLEKGLKDGETLGKIYMCPKRLRGGRAHMQKGYADAKRISNRFGTATWFLTFTGNPAWDLVKNNLRKGENYADRPDIVVRAFAAYLSELMKDITEREILGPVEAYFYSVEHQKRGMPHIHMVIINKIQSDSNTPNFVNDYVCAEIPDLPNPNDKSPAAEQQRRLHRIITAMFLHDCSDTSPCRVDGICTKRFPKEYSQTTVLNTNDYTTYRRRPPISSSLIPNVFDSLTDVGKKMYGNSYLKKTRNGVQVPMDNRHVVSYNPFLALKYNCHHNLEFIGLQKCEDYTFKYVLKGNDMAYVEVKGQNGTKVKNYDEITHHFKCRFLSSSEAMSRLLSLPIYKMSHTVHTSYVSLPGQQPLIFEEGKEAEMVEKLKRHEKNELTEYFALCARDPAARKYSFIEINSYYWYDRSKKVWKKREKDIGEVLVRIGAVNPTKPELVALRLLMMAKKGPTSYEDVRTVGKIVYETFSEAAQAMGLMEKDEMWKACMDDFLGEKVNAYKFRRFFTMILFHSKPANPKALFEHYLEKLAPTRSNLETTEEKTEFVLQRIQFLLHQYNSDCESIGLPSPKEFNFFDMELEDYNYDFDDSADDTKAPKSWKDVADALYAKLKSVQITAFTDIMEAVNDGKIKEKLFFVTGSGGTGKTLLFKAIIARIRANKQQYVATASTGIAALLLPGGQTAHSAFKIANDIDPTSVPNIGYETIYAERLRAASVIFIDEVSMLHKNVLNYIDKTLRSVYPKNSLEHEAPFANKVVVLSGDFRQLPPVVPRGGMAGEIEASIKSCEEFQLFKKYQLKENMRVEEGEQEFVKWLDEVGSAKNNLKEFIDFQDVTTPYMPIPPEMNSLNISTLIDFCFPQHVLAKPLEHLKELCGSALLAPTNKSVDSLNEIILNKLPGRATTFESIDRVLMKDEDAALQAINVDSADSSLEHIHEKTPTGLPPHKLKLKVGCKVMLIKNLSLRDGLCNGTILQVLKMSDTLLWCKIPGVDGQPDKEVILPKIKFEYGTSKKDRVTPFSRIQFPVRLSFACTINKAQGQTLDKVGICLDEQQVFSHGQLYVALSRVRKQKDVRILSNSSAVLNTAINIVYPPLIE